MILNKGFCVWIRGAGCIFVEMLQGAPAFPGESDEFEQLQTIWTVSERAIHPDGKVQEKESDALMWPCRSWACPLRTAGLESASCPTINQVRFSISVSKCFRKIEIKNQPIGFILSSKVDFCQQMIELSECFYYYGTVYLYTHYFI